MPRTVKVDLDLGGTAKEGLEGIGVTVTITEEKVEGLNRSLKQTERDAAKAAASMQLLALETNAAGDNINKFGNKTTVLDELEKGIVHTRNEVVKLGKEFDRTGNIDIFKDLRRAKGDLAGLENLRKEITSSLKAAGDEGAKSLFSGFSSALNGFMSTPVLGPLSVAVIAGIVAVLLPAINGAFLALGGMSGLALGIVGQLKNPVIHETFTSVVEDLEKTLATATAPFAQPLINAMKSIGLALEDAIGSIDFGALASGLEPLVTGLGQFITNMMPGFNKMLTASGPLLAEVGRGLAQLGEAASDMFTMFAMGGHGAQEGLRALFYTLAGGLALIGVIVLTASKTFEFLVAVLDDVAPALEKVFHFLANFPIIGTFFTALEWAAHGIASFVHALRDTGPDTVTFARNLGTAGAAATLTSDQIGEMVNKMNAVKNTADTAAAALTQKIFTALMSVDQATLAWHQSLTSLKKALDENGHHIDINTEKGQNNRQAILASVTANMSQYQAFVAAGGSAADATAAYESNTRALEDQLHKAHFTQAEINGLIGKYRDVPGEVNTNILMRGIEDALNNLGNLIAKINGLDGRNFGFTVTETDIRKQINEEGNFGHTQGRWGGIYEHAASGLLRAGIYSPVNPARYAFAEPETGGEGFVPRLGNYQRSTAVIDQEARWYGGRFAPGGGVGIGSQAVNVGVTIYAGMGTDGAALGRQVADVLIPFVRANGGNVQAVLGAL